MEEKRRFKDFTDSELIILRKSLDIAGFSTLCEEVCKEIEKRKIIR